MEDDMNLKKKLFVVVASAALVGASLSAEAIEVNSKFAINVDYYRGDAGNLNSDGIDSNDVAEQQFILRRARASFDAKVNDLVSGFIQLQADDNSSTGARSSALKDAYIDLDFAPMAMLRAGTFKYEFDLSGRESFTVMPFMDRAIVTTAVASSLTGTASDFRDKGVSLIGKSSAFGYGIGLWQGQGPDANDNNDKFGYTANAWGKLAGVKINLGYLSSDNAKPDATTTNKYVANTVGAVYDEGALMVRAEYYEGKRKSATTQDLKGYYVMGVYTVVENVDLAARYQQFKDEKWGASNNEIRSTDLGVKYYFERKGRAGTSIAVNYMFRNADSGVTQKIFDERGASVTDDNINNVLMARLQVQF
jgi:phosphate-selective porin